MWMLQHLRPRLQPLPASHNGLQHSFNLLPIIIYLQDDRGWEYKGSQTFFIDDADDKNLESSLIPARAVRE